MSLALPPDSHRRVHAKRLGARLTKALHDGKISKRGLALELGTARSLVTMWCKGDALPSLEVAAKLARAVGDDEILALARAARVLTCPVDQREFEWRGGGNALYCSDRCRKIGANANSRKPPVTMLEGQIAELRQAVGDYCRGCEPEGVCRTFDCPLRGVSPLPLKLGTEVDEVEPWSQGPLSIEGRQALGDKARARWADPEYKARVGEAVRRARWGDRAAS